MGKLVELENISKVYTNNNVLRNISLTLDKGHVIAVLGGNGVGKSTLLQIIAGVEQPSSGKVYYDNRNIKIGYVPERFPKLIRFTPSEYLNYIGKISGITKALIKNTIPDLLDRFRLKELDNQRIMNLSKGNIQKVGIIQAIMQRPELLILDEPTSGLDFHAQQELLAIIKELKEVGTTILLTYHESTIFGNVIDTAYYLNQGLLTKTNGIIKEPIKLLEIEHINESYVTQWDEVLYVEKMNHKLLLYVHLKNTDKILYRILQLQGSIHRVVTIDNTMEKLHIE